MVVHATHGGATTTGPDATPPPAICQNLGGGGGGGGGGGAGGAVWGGGGRLEGGGGVWPRGGGFPRWGGLRTTHYYHMRWRAPNAGSSLHSQLHLSRTSSCESGAQSMHGLMKGKHAQKNPALLAPQPPRRQSLKTRGGGGGCRIQGPGPANPPGEATPRSRRTPNVGRAIGAETQAAHRHRRWNTLHCPILRWHGCPCSALWTPATAWGCY